jgi:hypothetical protein
MTSVEIVSTLFRVNWLDSLLISKAVFPGGVDPDLDGLLVALGSVVLFVDEREPVVVWLLLDVRSLLDERVLPLLLPRERLPSEGVTPDGDLDNAIRSIRERDVFISPKATLKPDKLSDT